MGPDRHHPPKPTLAATRHRPRAIAASAAMASLAAIAGFAAAQFPGARSDPRTPRALPLEEALVETLRIEGQVQSWTLRKLCIDGQAYWVGFGEAAPTGLSASFKDGRPEPCTRRSR
jgi:hypothetical protein